MPVSLNEPLSALQRLCEEVQYSELLDEAAGLNHPCDRMVREGAREGGTREETRFMCIYMHVLHAFINFMLAHIHTYYMYMYRFMWQHLQSQPV